MAGPSVYGGQVQRPSVLILIAVASVTVACSAAHRTSPAPATSNDPLTTLVSIQATTSTTLSIVGLPATQVAAPPKLAHVFPVLPASAATYGRSHHDYPATDIFAPCGSRVVTPVDGVIQDVSALDQWDPKVDDGATRGGLSISIIGDDGVRYYGSHFKQLDPAVAPGARVSAGEGLGEVGNTGNAKGVACHLHFGLSPLRCAPGDWWTRRGAFYPWPYLDDWKRGANKSPRGEADAWRSAHPCSTDRSPSP